ncbi:polysaccharide deacetylase family protein [Streptomyces sp. enrichment culture]|uniref:polysaccharide deacetylase family protein n=1 Tax=Streptomyces sp. enrichment culture TaxID=1795815 RepID=UPI003F5491B6
MRFSARRLSVLAAFCVLLTGCGTRAPAAGPADRHPAATPSPVASAPSGAPALTGAGAGAGADAARRVPPTLAPGPGGLTPVFERRADPGAGSGSGSGPGSAAGKTVALTFDADMTADQGPRAARGERFDNPALIATLRRLDVDATVFMTGRWAEEYPDQARSIGTDPRFEIANHSYSHHAFRSPCYGLPTVGRAEMAADVERAFAAFRAVGVRNVVPYFRFPGGCYDDEALRALAPTRVTAVQWDVVGGDAFAKDADAVARQVLDGVRPGSVVVLHCTLSAAPVTEQAVRRIVPELRARGYRFVKVSELMAAS